MKGLRVSVFLVIFLSLLSFLFAFFFYVYQQQVVERKVYDAKIEVSSDIGFDVNNTAFIFGAVPPGAGAIRRVIVNNSDDSELFVRIVPHGEMEKFVSFQEVTVGKQTVQEVSIKATVPQGMEHGIYEGSIEVLMIRKK